MTSISSSFAARLARSVGATLFISAVAACAPGDDEPADVDDATRTRVIAAASPAASTLAETLSGELMAAVSEGGPAHAIGFCAEEALALTDSVAADLGDGWQVKRTAQRTRNPANAPDDLEADALDRFHAAEVDGDGLEELVQRTPDGGFRYYRPLRIAPLCAECHGARDELEPAVLEAIDERYPDDEATGYTEGELRGLIRITVPAGAIEAS